jgi:hypothetical protein
MLYLGPLYLVFGAFEIMIDVQSLQSHLLSWQALVPLSDAPRNF